MKSTMFLAALAVIGGAMPAQAETQAAAAAAATNAQAAPAAQQAGQAANSGKFFVAGRPGWGAYGGYRSWSYGTPYGGYSYVGYPYGGYPYGPFY